LEEGMEGEAEVEVLALDGGDRDRDCCENVKYEYDGIDKHMLYNKTIATSSLAHMPVLP
jgi:hypothetical protein